MINILNRKPTRGAESRWCTQGGGPRQVRLPVRRRHRELPFARRHAWPRQCGSPKALQAGRLAREHRPRRDLRQGRGRSGTRERTACRLRGRRVECAAGAEGPYLAHGEEPAWRRQRYGATLLGHDTRRTGALCEWRQEHP